MDMIRILIAATALSCGLALANASLAQEDETDFTTVQEMMSAKEFVDAGLHELSQQQLNALNEWIQTNMSATPGQGGGGQQLASASGTTGGGDQRGMHPEEQDDIHSRIIGEFKGWYGYSEFHLENGMVWQQVASDTMKGVRMNDPKVVISQAMLGGWRLKVEGVNKTTNVKRIK